MPAPNPTPIPYERNPIRCPQCAALHLAMTTEATTEVEQVIPGYHPTQKTAMLLGDNEYTAVIASALPVRLTSDPIAEYKTTVVGLEILAHIIIPEPFKGRAR